MSKARCYNFCFPKKYRVGRYRSSKISKKPCVEKADFRPSSAHLQNSQQVCMPDNALRRKVLVPVSTVKEAALKNIFGEEITKKLKTSRFQLKKCTFFTSTKSALFLRNGKKQQWFFVFRLESTQEWQCNSCVGGQVLNPPFLDRRLIFHYFGDCLRVE